MSVLAFIKENRVLVAGLILPLLLVVVLAFAKTLPATLVDAPVYKVAFSSQNWSGQGQILLKIDDQGHLTASYQKNEGYVAQTNIASPVPTTTLYVYDPTTSQIKNYDFSLGTDEKLPSVATFKDAKFSTQLISPDGYSFENYYYSHNSLITEIFMSRSSTQGPVLVKENRVIKLPLPNQYYGSFNFVGWITEGDVK
ncbi:MAG: hypothetical protein WC043_06275 [Pseudobdellovibrionaceae bacterium]